MSELKICVCGCWPELAEFKAEIARLRAALEEIATETPDLEPAELYDLDLADAGRYIAKLQNIARAALAGKE